MPGIAAAHVDAHGHVLRPVLDGFVDGVDVEVDQLVRIVAALAHVLHVGGIADHRQRHLVHLQIGAAARREVGDFFAHDACDVVDIGVAVLVDAEHRIAGEEMRDRRGRQVRLLRPLRRGLEELVIPRRKRLAARQLLRDLGLAHHPELLAVEHGDGKSALHRLGPEPVAAVVQEFAPAALAVFAVGDGADADALLHGDRFADRLVLDALEGVAPDLAGRVLVARVHQPVRTGQAADMLRAKRWPRIGHVPLPGSSFSAPPLAKPRGLKLTLSAPRPPWRVSCRYAPRSSSSWAGS